MEHHRQHSVPRGLLLALCFILGGCFDWASPPDYPQPPDLTLLIDWGLWRSPAWSPTRPEIAFVSAAWPPSALFRADVATGEVVTLAGEIPLSSTMALWWRGLGGNSQGPAWSPQGDRIAFGYHPNELTDDIAVVGRDGSGWVSLGEGSDPAWSPDGEWIAFSRVGEGIFVAHPDGTGERQLTHEYDFAPTWSPDSNRLVFVSWRDGNREVYAVNADGSGERRLTNNPDTDYQPAWSPDGSRIAFCSWGRGGPSIYTVSPDGTDQVLVAAEGGSYPTWSPDGHWIAFEEYELYEVAAQGGGRRLLARMADCSIEELSWSPDGQTIAFLCGTSESIGHPEVMSRSRIYMLQVPSRE